MKSYEALHGQLRKAQRASDRAVRSRALARRRLDDADGVVRERRQIELQLSREIVALLARPAEDGGGELPRVTIREVGDHDHLQPADCGELPQADFPRAAPRAE